MFSSIQNNFKVFASFVVVGFLVLGILAIISTGSNPDFSATPGTRTSPTIAQPPATATVQAVITSPATLNAAPPTSSLTPQGAISAVVIVTPTPTFSAAVTLINPTNTVFSSPTSQATSTPPPVVKLTPAASNTTLPDNLKLSAEERTALVKLDTDIAGLNASINRLDSLMTDTHPEEPGWFTKLNTEINYWKQLEDYYKLTRMPLRVGSQVMPVWISALARMGRAGELLPKAYRTADGIAVSQADQEVAFAELEITRTTKIITSLKQK